MAERAAPDPVRELWERFEARDWDGAAGQLHPEFVGDWPLTGERFRGPADFFAMNRAHPAPNWHIRIVSIVWAGDEVAAEVEVPSDGAVDFCLGFYTLRDGRIHRAREYWASQAIEAIPAWRARWTERIG